MRVAILPSGALLADTAPGDDEASDGLSVAARTRVARAFARGTGHALLDLGATELHAPLAPPLGFFLATYAVRAGSSGRVQHRPLARALEESSARGDRQALLHLLVPLQRAAEQATWLAELIDSGAIYEAMAWAPAEAHRFLRAVPTFEAAGLVVRVPDWWRPRRPPRPEVTVRVGEKKPSAVGMDALLDFSVAVALGDEKLTAAEVRQLLASSEGLVRLRGQWVELDRERLREVLAHWERVRREASEGGLSFLEGMRLLAGAARTEDDA